ncbi:hypothetical protein C0J52_01410 [Blattella germanica]|nr:hypothetical protein C0J52_01410 [Blattella germanica]
MTTNTKHFETLNTKHNLTLFKSPQSAKRRMSLVNKEIPSTSNGCSSPSGFISLKDQQKKLLIGVTQMTSTNNKADNLNTCSELIAAARKLNCKMVFLPEACDYIGESKEETMLLAEPLDGPTVKSFCKMAKDNKIWISVGGVHEKCYDMRFPEMSMWMAKLNAQLLTFPSAFTYATGSNHWEPLLRARAIENQCFVVAAAQTGFHNKNRHSWGHAMVVDPSGAKLAECLQGRAIVVAEINLGNIDREKGAFPLWAERRQDLYGELVVKKQTLPDTEYIFCGIEIEMERVLMTSKRSIAFMSCNPVVPGLADVLVAPLRQVANISDLAEVESRDLFMLVNRVQKVLEKFSPNSATTNFTKEGKEHLCVHLIPRKENDFPCIDDVYAYLTAHEESCDKLGNDIKHEVSKITDRIRQLFLFE